MLSSIRDTITPVNVEASSRVPSGIAPAAARAGSESQLVELWLHGRSEHTVRAYRGDVNRFLVRAGKPFDEVTLADLQSFATSLESLAPSSRCRILSAVKSLLAFGHRIGYLPFDVGGALRLPAVRNRLAERILPEADLHRILTLGPEGAPGGRNRAILTLLYASGMRVSELCGLSWRDLQPNGDGGQVTVFGKGGTTRSIQVPPSVWKLLTGLRNAEAGAQRGAPSGAPSGPDHPVFCSRKKRGGGRLRPLAVLRVVRQAARRAGVDLPVSPHWFRHAHASHALDRGAPIHLVQATLGHASLTTTGRYLHARPKDSSSRFLSL
jgi:integrase/recombinase XerD